MITDNIIDTNADWECHASLNVLAVDLMKEKCDIRYVELVSVSTRRDLFWMD